MITACLLGENACQSIPNSAERWNLSADCKLLHCKLHKPIDEARACFESVSNLNL